VQQPGDGHHERRECHHSQELQLPAPPSSIGHASCISVVPRQGPSRRGSHSDGAKDCAPRGRTSHRLMVGAALLDEVAPDSARAEGEQERQCQAGHTDYVERR
jgi:hypothetical protein